MRTERERESVQANNTGATNKATSFFKDCEGDVKKSTKTKKWKPF